MNEAGQQVLVSVLVVAVLVAAWVGAMFYVDHKRWEQKVATDVDKKRNAIMAGYHFADTVIKVSQDIDYLKEKIGEAKAKDRNSAWARGAQDRLNEHVRNQNALSR